MLLRTISGRQGSLHTRALTCVAVTAAGSTLLAAVAVNDLERSAAHPTIHGFGDSVWWAFTPVSTVGYGDVYPVTAGALIVVRVSLFGVITASLATFFLRNVRQVEEDVTENELAARLARVELLLQELFSNGTADATR